jgi:hypothetical protein
MQHPGFDLDLWRGRLLRAVDDSSVTPAFRVSGGLLTDSPISIIVAEHYRAAAAAYGARLGARAPVDRFVFGKGHAVARHLTKINGLPYRPKGRPWPRDCHGAVMTFLTQFCFADSRDLVGELPGDVLCVFARTESGRYSIERCAGKVDFDRTEFGEFMVDPNSDMDSLLFEWHPLGLDDLPGPADVPEPRTFFPTCYALCYRSSDYIDDVSAANEVRAVVPSEYLSENEFVKQFTLRALVRHTGMKIGGLPFWYGKSLLEVDARFLASFSGVNLAVGWPYPWANVPEPVRLDECIARENFLDFRDGCCINLFLKEDGAVHWTAEFL